MDNVICMFLHYALLFCCDLVAFAKRTFGCPLCPSLHTRPPPQLKKRWPNGHSYSKPTYPRTYPSRRCSRSFLLPSRRRFSFFGDVGSSIAFTVAGLETSVWARASPRVGKASILTTEGIAGFTTFSELVTFRPLYKYLVISQLRSDVSMLTWRLRAKNWPFVCIHCFIQTIFFFRVLHLALGFATDVILLSCCRFIVFQCFASCV